MSEQPSRIKTALVTYFPMFIATLSLVTSIFNGYLNNKFIDIIQHNVSRTEDMRTCKEAIDAYFQVKFRSGVLAAAASGASASTISPAQADIDAGNAVARFAALGTYLANLRGEAVRARYTELTRLLEQAMWQARTTPVADVPKLFEPADTVFAEVNDACVRSAQGRG